MANFSILSIDLKLRAMQNGDFLRYHVQGVCIPDIAFADIENLLKFATQDIPKKNIYLKKDSRKFKKEFLFKT